MSENKSNTKADGAFLSRELMGNVPWAIGSQLILFIVSILTTRVIVKGLDDKEAFGVYRLCALIAEYLLLVCCLGLNIALMRFVPELRVKGSKAGLVRLLRSSFMAQLLTMLPVGLLLYALKPKMDLWLFKGDSGFLLLLVAILLVGRLGRTFAEDALTSLFRMRAVSILALTYGVCLLGVTSIVLRYYPSPAAVLVSQSSVLFIVATVGGLLLVRSIRQLDWTGSSEGIGMKRVLNLALPRQFTQLSSLITQRYSEVFFIGFFCTPELVGIYELGNWLPFALITFLPQSLRGLFTSGFAEAYSRDESCLGRLVTTYYKVLIIVVLPVSAFGAFFATDAIRVLVDEDMMVAGPVASAFFVIHLLPLLSAPLAIAIVTKEKSLQVTPLQVMMIVVNLAFDWYFISRYEIVGACVAIVATWVVTIPVRLYVNSRLVGGIYFPMLFFLKMVALLFGLAYLFTFLVDEPGFLLLSGLVIAYLVVYGGMLRWLRLIHHDDVAELREMGFSKMNRVLEMFVAPEKV